MDNYRITIEPISAEAKKSDPTPVTILAAGYILGANESDPMEPFLLPGESAHGTVHIRAQGNRIPDTILYMIDNLPPDIVQALAMGILEKRFAQHGAQDEPTLRTSDLQSEFEQLLREADNYD